MASGPPNSLTRRPHAYVRSLFEVSKAPPHAARRRDSAVPSLGRNRVETTVLPLPLGGGPFPQFQLKTRVPAKAFSPR